MVITSLMSCAKTLNIPYVGINAYFSSISIDTRTLKEGELFIAIKGEKWDAHDFIELAQKKKAAAIISEIPIASCIPCLVVPNTRRALGLLAQQHRLQFKLPIIALTGSCGKTTTKEYLRHIFSRSGSVLSPVESFNNDIGLPLTLLQLKKKHCIAILELGANAIGEIAWLTQLAQPTVAMILNIAPVHLEGFGSIENIAKAKAEIFQGLPKNGKAVLPQEFKDRFHHYAPNQNTLYFGYNRTMDLYAKNIRIEANNNASFTLVFKKEIATIHLSLPGRHQIDNALAAASAAVSLGISLSQIKLGLEAAKVVPHRLEICTSERYGIIINDAYNANLKSVEAALSVLASYPEPRLLILGDMKELGKWSHRYHQLVGQLAKKHYVQLVFTYGKYAKTTAHAFGQKEHHFYSQQALITALKNQLNSHCTTLIKGSRCMQMEKVVHALIASTG